LRLVKGGAEPLCDGLIDRRAGRDLLVRLACAVQRDAGLLELPGSTLVDIQAVLRSRPAKVNLLTSILDDRSGGLRVKDRRDSVALAAEVLRPELLHVVGCGDVLVMRHLGAGRQFGWRQVVTDKAIEVAVAVVEALG